METGTLDFDALMDTGDEYPGFEIAKFTPVAAKDDDSILRTPEPENDEDPMEKLDKKTSGSDNSYEGHTADKTIEKKLEFGETPKDTAHKPVNATHLDDVSENQGAMKRALDDSWSENKYMKTADEPEVKKKKHMYLQPPKPKMRLWDGKKESNKEKQIEEERERDNIGPECEEFDRSRARSESPDKFNGDSDSSGMMSQGEDSRSEMDKGEEKESAKMDEDDPHQQSFLSFFNLKPGSGGAKPDADKKKKDNSKEVDFYSRKRLRIRKKVSYAEDVAEDNDEEYKGEEEEDIEDHMLNIRRRRSSGGNSTKRKPTTFAAASYAQALQQLSPRPPVKPLVNPTINPAPQASPVQLPSMLLKQRLPMPKMPMPAGNSLLGAPTTAAGQIKGLFECGLCGTFFNTASQFIAHQEHAHATENKSGRSGMETFRCEICQFVLTNRFAYLEHKRMKHMKNQVTFSCHKCGRTFGYLMDLQRHKDQCGVNSPMCGLCNLKFSTLQELVNHRNKMHRAGATRQWLFCINNSCSFRCLTQHEMNQHVKSKHMTSELFSCNAPGCARIFNTREKLNEHRKEVHASEFIVQYQCMECKMCCSSKTLLAEHQYLHTMDKLRKCDICMRQFATISQLKRHKEVHATKGTVQCSSCSRWCVDKQELMGHVCKEKNSKFSSMVLYYCDICMKDFRADEMMFKHRREHKGYYQCSTCLWECKSEADYFDHREVHGLFTCTECCEELPSRIDMETHVKAHKYYVKMIQTEFDGKNAPVMYLCPNLMNMIKA